MEIPIAIKIECARGEIVSAVAMAKLKYELPSCIISGIISSVLADIRAEEKIEVINATNEMLGEKNKELEKAASAAKAVLHESEEGIRERREDGTVVEETKNVEKVRTKKGTVSEMLEEVKRSECAE